MYGFIIHVLMNSKTSFTIETKRRPLVLSCCSSGVYQGAVWAKKAAWVLKGQQHREGSVVHYNNKRLVHPGLIVHFRKLLILLERANKSVFLMLWKEMVQGGYGTDRFKLTLKDTWLRKDVDRSDDTQLKGVAPEQHTRSRVWPSEYVGKSVNCYKSVRSRHDTKSFTRGFLNIIHVYIKVTQQNYIGSPRAQGGCKDCEFI